MRSQRRRRRQIVFSIVAAIAALVSSPPSSGQDLVINEVMSSNAATLLDEDGDSSDWIEVHNRGSEGLQLHGHCLSDDADPFQWVFPPIVIPAKGHLIVFASGKDKYDAAAHWETVIDRGDAWRYLIPSSEPAAAWRAPGYDDGMWSVGGTGIGYGDDDDLTQVPAGTISVYARKTFRIDDPAAITHAFLDLDFDDAFVAYLNGEEIARENIGVPGVPPSWSDVATTYTEPALVTGGRLFHYEVPRLHAVLRSGENVLAIQLHNTGAGSSDLTLIPFLTLGMEDAPPDARGPAEILRPSLPSLHAGFQLDAQGETITLTSPLGVLLDSVDSGALPTDVSRGRYPDGSGAFSYHDAPTPGGPNTSPGHETLGPTPTFSHEGGFHPGPFSLALSTDRPGAAIRFTLDGSEPADDSPAYSGAIPIASTTVVRARADEAGAIRSRSVTHTFIVGSSFALPVVSISTDPANFFDDEIGIYVLGTDYDPSFPYFGSNIWEDWERPVHIELFEEDGTLGFSADAGAKIFGGWSRGNPQRSLALFARGRYGTSRFRYRIFPDKDIDSFESFVLRNSGNDWGTTHFRDALMTSLVADRVDCQAYRPAVAFINGEYWGILNLREKVNEHFLESNHDGVRSDQIDLLEADATPIHGDSEHYRSMLDLLTQGDPADPAVYSRVTEMVDVDEFMDYEASQIYFDNTDWPGNNIKFWRPRVEGGRWRWILFDTDFGFGLWNGGNYANNTLAFALEPNGPGWPNPPWSTFLLRRLTLNQEFVRRFVNRFATLLDTSFRADRIVARINAMQAALERDMPAHLARWGGSVTAWKSNVGVLRTFASPRASYVRSHLASRFGLGASARLYLDASPARSGEVEIEGIRIPTYPWVGTYFRGVQIEMVAIPRPGYRFLRWEGLSPGEAAATSVALSGDLHLEAAFELDCSAVGPVVINEISYNAPADADPGDWVELHNPGSEAVDIGDWTFRDASDAHVFTVPPGTRLEGGAHLVLCANAAAFAARFPGVENRLGDLGYSLSGGGELLRLLDASGSVVDSVMYDDAPPWPEAADGGGATLALRNPFLDNAYPVSWAASPDGGTPGSRNDVFEDLEGSCAARPRFRRGDSNADGVVDVADPIDTLGFLFLATGTVSCLDALDANDDGSIDVADPLTTLLDLFAGTVEIPAPGPAACGPDPTSDELGCASLAPCE